MRNLVVCVRKTSDHFDPDLLDNIGHFMNICLNKVEVSPHGLIFDEDEATGCPMPPEALPTPFKVVLSIFYRFLSKIGSTPVLPDFFPIYPFKGTPDIPPVVEVMLVSYLTPINHFSWPS